ERPALTIELQARAASRWRHATVLIPLTMTDSAGQWHREYGFRARRFASSRNDEDAVRRQLPIGHDPGWSQGVGVARVVAVASLEAGSSTPFTMAATRQR